MIGYHDDPAATAATIGEDGFLATGDLGELNEDGYLRYRGRHKQMIKSGGENIAIGEVEEAMRSHPDVADAVLVPVPHERFAEVGFAFVRPVHDTVDLDDVRAHLRERLANFKIPKYLEAMTTSRGPAVARSIDWALPDRQPRRAEVAVSASPVVVVDTPRAGVGRIVLSRRIKRNTINHEMVELIEAGLASFVQSGVGVAVLSGDGDVFSAGADLTEVGGPRPPAADRLQALLVDTPVFVVTVLDGSAFGAGISVLSTCPVIVRD